MRKTKSFTYIYPMLKDVLKFRDLISNVFIGDDSYPNLEGNIFILYKFSGEQAFLAYEEKMKEHPLHLSTYDPDKSHIMMVFKAPEFHQEDLNLLLDSKYSKISNAYKKILLAFHNISKEHPVGEVLYKPEIAFKKLEQKLELSESLPRTQEVSSILDKKTREHYNGTYKIMSAITPNEEFDNKPLKFNTREGE